MKNLPLHIKIIIGLILGVIWAFISSSLGWNQFTTHWINPFGVIFIRLLKFIAVPLVLFSIISGVANLSDTTKLGRLAVKTIGTYLVTTVAAISIGLILVNLVKPGNLMDSDQRLKNRLNYEAWYFDTFQGTPIDGQSYINDPKYAQLREEILGTKDYQVVDEKVSKKMEVAKKSKDDSPLQFIVEMIPENVIHSISSNSLMLQIIFFAIFFGITLAVLPSDKTRAVVDLINGLNEVFLKMVETIMNYAPFFVFALLAGVIAKMANTPAEVLEIFKGLGTYSVTVILGLAIMMLVVYPAILKSFVRRIGYAEFFQKISPAQFLAFSTSSSAATLPVTMDCVEKNMGVSKNITSFVLPIGATVNMDGTSLYQAVAVIFLAQLHMVELTLAQQLTIVLTATLASIGSAAVPGAGLVMLIIVLQSVGLNPAWIAIVFPVDRILDMCRTTVNVTGDATVSTVMASWEGDLNK